MRGRAGGLSAAALIDGDIDQHAAGPHAPQHVTPNQLRRPCPGYQHSADQQIDRRQYLEQMRLVRVQGVRGVESDVEKPHALEIDFQNRHIRPEALGHASGVDA